VNLGVTKLCTEKNEKWILILRLLRKLILVFLILFICMVLICFKRNHV